MTANDFKIGQQIKMCSSSQYFSEQGQHGMGKINRIVHNDYYRVMFEDGYENTYHDEDLITITWKDRYNDT